MKYFESKNPRRSWNQTLLLMISLISKPKISKGGKRKNKEGVQPESLAKGEASRGGRHGFPLYSSPSEITFLLFASLHPLSQSTDSSRGNLSKDLRVLDFVLQPI